MKELMRVFRGVSGGHHSESRGVIKTTLLNLHESEPFILSEAYARTQMLDLLVNGNVTLRDGPPDVPGYELRKKALGARIFLSAAEQAGLSDKVEQLADFIAYHGSKEEEQHLPNITLEELSKINRAYSVFRDELFQSKVDWRSGLSQYRKKRIGDLKKRFFDHSANGIESYSLALQLHLRSRKIRE